MNAVGKRARLDRRSKRHIKVDDAADVVAALRLWAGGGGTRGPDGQWMRAATTAMLDRWDASPLVLRVDGDFAAALIDSHTDVELVPDWLDRFPFNAIAYSLAEPLSLHDGIRLCHYTGMIATGIRSVDATGVPGLSPTPTSGDRWRLDGAQFTRYIDVAGSDGVRCLWVFKEDGDPRPRLQTVTFQLRGELADHATTLAELISASVSMATDFEQSQGQELPTLITLSLSLLLYTAATDPDLDWPPPEQIARPHQIKSTQIGNLGWRTGAALRQHRTPPPGTASGPDAAGAAPALSGRRLPAHIRKAHWHRVRVAERNPTGRVIGSLQGVQGVDWHYELRWYPPTPVNAEHGLSPTIRDP